jgi:hypothetical protein
LAKPSNLSNESRNVVTGMGDERGVLVPPLVVDIDVSTWVLDQRGRHDGASVELGPAGTGVGGVVADGADRNQACGVVVIKKPNMPRAGRGTFGAALNGVKFVGQVRHSAILPELRRGCS